MCAIPRDLLLMQHTPSEAMRVPERRESTHELFVPPNNQIVSRITVNAEPGELVKGLQEDQPAKRVLTPTSSPVEATLGGEARPTVGFLALPWRKSGCMYAVAVFAAGLWFGVCAAIPRRDG